MKHKKLFAILTLVCFMFTLMPVAAFADGETVTVVTTEQLKEKLNEFGDAGAGSNTVIIGANLQLAEGETWTPVTVDGYNGADVITIEGGGHTISGLNAPLFSGGFAGGSGIVIKDLTIKDSTIISANELGSGAFIETVDSMDVITLSNCHLVNSSVTGSRTGGLIGWTSGYNNQNDGAVKTFVTIENCSVTGCTINAGEESAGAIFGHAGANPWTFTKIKNCTVTGNTINGGSDRTGVLIGTANVGKITIDGYSIDNNTINGSVSDQICGRESFGDNNEGSLEIKSPVAEIGENKYTDLAEAFAAAQEGDTITLLSDLDLADWTSVDVKKAIILEGDKKTITGLTAPLVNNASANFTVNNLTISGANIEVESANGLDNDTSAAALVQWANAGTLTLNNVSVNGSTIEGDGYVAALVGFVDSTAASVTVSGGEISGNTLTAGGVVGTVAGLTYKDVTINDVTISGNALTSTSDNNTRPDKVGLVVGRPCAGTISISATVDDTNSAEPGDGTIVGSLSGGNAVITGGSYPVDPTVTGKTDQAASVKEGYVVKNQNGVFTVVEQPDDSTTDDNDAVTPSKPSSSSGSGFSGSYNYPVNATANGADITLSDNNAIAGETVTITITPDAGKQVDEVIVTDADGDVITVTKVGDNQYSFTMPAGKVNVSVTTEAIDYDTKIVLQIANKNVVVDGRTISNDVAPVIQGDRTLVPIRVIVEALGGEVDWDEATRTVTITIDGKVLTLVIDEMIPGFGQGATIMDNRTYVPIRYVAEYIGAHVDWIAETQQIVILK